MQIVAAIVVPDDQVLTPFGEVHSDAFGEIVLQVYDRLANTSHDPVPSFHLVPGW